MITSIVRAVAGFACLSLASVGLSACATQVDPPEPDKSIDPSSDPIAQVEQGLDGQIPNCDRGTGSYIGEKPIISVGRDCAGNPLGECRIGRFIMTWQCVLMPNGQIVPQNVLGTTDLCRCDRGFTCC